MRQIKFRAWDKKDKVMREVYGIQFPKISNHGNRQNTIIEMHCSDYDGQKAIILSDFTDSVDRVELMQFTGLKDKNGKEIYEGDILLNTTIKPQKIKIVLKKVIGAFGDAFDIEKLPNEKGMIWRYDMDKIEVIGNIYENPELLTK